MSGDASYEKLTPAWQYIDYEQAYFLKDQLQYFKKHRPLQGLRLLHNIPLSLETVCKIQGLLAAGAHVIATWPHNIIPHQFALAKKLLEAAGVACLTKDAIEGTFDFHLDCGAQLLHLRAPQIGCVELTGTGSQIYRKHKALSYPVLSIDDSQTKALETFFGTGQACVQSLKEQFKLQLQGLNILIIGFGRVGKGVAYALAKEGALIHILDVCEHSQKYAQKYGFSFAVAGSAQAQFLIQKAQMVLTASGIENLLSTHYDSAAFKGKILANVGAEDEFGPHFAPSEILNDKQPVNFALAESTAMRYLDPSLYLHNQGCELLLKGNFQRGYHPLPLSLDQNVLLKWQTYHQESLVPMQESLIL